MDNQLIRKLTIPASDCDYSSRLSVPDTFALFQDLATDHAHALNIAGPDLAPRHLFWLAVKTKVKFYRRPAMNEPVEAETWPEPAERIRCNRDYRLAAAGEVLALGKTEWAVVNTETGQLRRGTEVFPEGIAFRSDVVWEEPFARLRDDFGEEPVFARYSVRSTDIDLGGHMNNVAYVRCLAGAFSTAEWDALDVKEMEVHFKAPCFEGEELALQKRERNGALEIRMSAGGRTVILASIRPAGRSAGN